jgi:hypothetical protein
MYDFFCKYMNVKKAMTSPHTIDEIVKEMTSIWKECKCCHFEEVCAEGGCADDMCMGGSRSGGGFADDMCMGGSRSGGGFADDMCMGGSRAGGRFADDMYARSSCFGGGSADDMCARGSRAGCDEHAEVCIICRMKFSTHVIMPCNHKTICRDCALNPTKLSTLNRKCPKCSGPLNFTMKSLDL